MKNKTQDKNVCTRSRHHIPLLVIFIVSVCFSLQCTSAPISISDKITIRQAVRLLAMITIVTIPKKFIKNHQC